MSTKEIVIAIKVLDHYAKVHQKVVEGSPEHCFADMLSLQSDVLSFAGIILKGRIGNKYLEQINFDAVVEEESQPTEPK